MWTELLKSFLLVLRVLWNNVLILLFLELLNLLIKLNNLYRSWKEWRLLISLQLMFIAEMLLMDLLNLKSHKQSLSLGNHNWSLNGHQIKMEMSHLDNSVGSLGKTIKLKINASLESLIGSDFTHMNMLEIHFVLSLLLLQIGAILHWLRH